MNDVDEVKSRVDIVALIGETVQLKKAGRNFKGLCPFHGEKTPSFMVSPERQSYHCFGCSEGGDIFSFVMKREAVDFPEALRMLAQRAGVELKERGRDSKGKQRLFEVVELATKYFQAAYQHTAGKVARDYVASREISEELVTKFRIGYAPDSYEAMVEALSKKGATNKELIDAGLAIEGRRGPYSRFRGRLMIPIADSTGVVRGFTGRVLNPEAKEAKYVNTPETPLYHKGRIVFALDLAKQEAIAKDQIVLVEGQMDVISAHGAGTANVVAASGTALTEEQVTQLARFTKNFVMALDADDAGRKALMRTIELVGERDIELKVAELGDTKDPDDLIKQDPKLWQDAVTNAVPVIDFLINHSLSGRKHPLDRLAIAEVLNTVLPVLRFRGPIDRDYYVEQLATTLGVEKSTVRQRLEEVTNDKTARAKAAEKTSEPTPTAGVSLPELVTQRMLGLVMLSPKLAPKLEAVDVRLLPEAYRAIAIGLQHLQKSGDNSYNKVTESPAERSLLDVCSMAAAEYESLAESEWAAEFDRLLARLKSLWIRQHQPKLLAAIKRAEESGDTDRRNRLMEEYTTLTKRIAHG